MKVDELQVNLFIVGAPKCGSTSLYYYLKKHPDILMSIDKEPDYFSRDDAGLGATEGNELFSDYMSKYQKNGKNYKYYGEASTLYLSSPIAIKNIYRANPNAKIIVLLRNPVDLVYAFHAEMIRNHCEDIENFEEAWGLRKERQVGRMLPEYIKYRRHVRVLDYERLGYLGAQLENVYSVFPEEQVKSIFLEDLANDTHAIYEEILEFLGLPHLAENSLDVYNANAQYRSLRFARWMDNPPDIFKKVASTIKNTLGLNDVELLGFFRKNNQVVRERPPLPDDLRYKIQDIYSSDVKKLSRLTGKNLQHWLN